MRGGRKGGLVFSYCQRGRQGVRRGGRRGLGRGRRFWLVTGKGFGVLEKGLKKIHHPLNHGDSFVCIHLCTVPSMSIV